MRKVLAAVVVSLLAVACSVHSDNPTYGDATRAYVAPAICEKQQSCIPASFAATYPGGVADCEKPLNDAVANPGELASCTVDQYRQCAADFRSAQCPTDPAKKGLPEEPASCKGC